MRWNTFLRIISRYFRIMNVIELNNFTSNWRFFICNIFIIIMTNKCKKMKIRFEQDGSFEQNHRIN